MPRNNHVICYQVEMTPENAPVIDQINKLLIGGDLTKVAPKSTEKPSKGTFKDPVESDSSLSFDTLKAAGAALRKKYGKDEGDAFGMDVLKGLGLKLGTSFPRSLSKVDEADYAAVISAFEKGPKTAADELNDDLDEGLEDDLDDGLGDDLDEIETPTPEAVKDALKSFAKDKEKGRDKAKKIMTDNGADNLAAVDDLSDAQLRKIFKAVT